MTTRHEFAEYCRKRQLSKSVEILKIIMISKDQFEYMLKQTSDTDMIESYCQCAQCGAIWVTTKQVNDILLNSKTVEDAYFKIENFGECEHRRYNDTNRKTRR
jgi:Zn-finger nucleic acid-binding protein